MGSSLSKIAVSNPHIHGGYRKTWTLVMNRLLGELAGCLGEVGYSGT